MRCSSRYAALNQTSKREAVEGSEVKTRIKNLFWSVHENKQVDSAERYGLHMSVATNVLISLNCLPRSCYPSLSFKRSVPSLLLVDL